MANTQDVHVVELDRDVPPTVRYTLCGWFNEHRNPARAYYTGPLKMGHAWAFLRGDRIDLARDDALGIGPPRWAFGWVALRDIESAEVVDVGLVLQLTNGDLLELASEAPFE